MHSYISKLGDILPEQAKDLLTPFYYRCQSVSANLEHNRPTTSVTKRRDAPDHIVVIVIDALRPDLIPDLSIDFTHAIAPSTWTFPSVTSLHTGLRPSDHGSVAHTQPDQTDYSIPSQTDSYPHFPLDLEAVGYNTCCVSAFPMPFLAIKGWYQKHQYFKDAKASKVLDYYRKWRKGRSSTAAYLHLSDLHAPVNPPEEYVENRGVDVSVPGLQNIGRYNTSFDEENPDCQYYREQKLQLHRAGLDYISEQISEIINEFKDDTLLIITGDHGEGLYEHQELDRSFTDSRPNYCLGHGGTPFDVIARVPLAILGPDNIQNNPNGGWPTLPNGGWPTLRDIPATILEQAIENPNAPGISLFKTIPESRSVICEGTRYGVERKAVYRGEEKVIRSETDDVTLITKLSPNGEEPVELSDSTVEELLAQLPDQWDNMQSTRKVSDITKKQLKSLGYR